MSKAHPFPLHPGSVAALFALDWAVYTANMLTYMHALRVWVPAGALLACVVTALIERYAARETPKSTLVKAVIGGVLVGLPLPLLGTALLAFAFAWWSSSLLPSPHGSQGR
jgi:hypothetical protein